MTSQRMTAEEAQFILYFHWRSKDFFKAVVAGEVPNARQAIKNLQASGFFEPSGKGYRPTDQAVVIARKTIFGWTH